MSLMSAHAAMAIVALALMWGISPIERYEPLGLWRIKKTLMSLAQGTLRRILTIV